MLKLKKVVSLCKFDVLVELAVGHSQRQKKNLFGLDPNRSFTGVYIGLGISTPSMRLTPTKDMLPTPGTISTATSINETFVTPTFKK